MLSNLAQVALAVEFTVAEIPETVSDEALPVADAVSPDLSIVTDAEVADDDAERAA